LSVKIFFLACESTLWCPAMEESEDENKRNGKFRRPNAT